MLPIKKKRKKVKGILFLAAVLLKCCHMDLYICRFPQLDGVLAGSLVECKRALFGLTQIKAAIVFP